MNTSMEYMNKFIDKLPSIPDLKEYRMYLLIRARELAIDAVKEEPLRKRNMVEKSIAYTTKAKLNDKELLTEVKHRFGIEEKASIGTLF